jgi:D-3-phosphoglycerate dehydrogenase / 2-oxoglutarate reductase
MSPFQILVLNQLSPAGLKRLPDAHYKIAKDCAAPDAILLRSHDLHSYDILPSVKAIGRAGAGTNNIPIDKMSARGVPVFNTPGANANAVKELVIAGMLLAARNLPGALRFTADLRGDPDAMDLAVESGKKNYAGIELANHTLGVIGLGKIGCLVADAAIRLGMQVLGYDPDITVDAAWSLPSLVKKANAIEDILKASDFITLHVPLLEVTRHLIRRERIEKMKRGAVLLNFSRDAVVDEAAVLQGLVSRALKYYVCDFPSPALAGQDGVIALPHLGASTREAEENCAVMVVDQMRDYLEHGNIRNAVNFPDLVMSREAPYRVAIANANVPNMLGQMSTAMAKAGLNIHNMTNKSRGDMAYTLVDIDSPADAGLTAALSAIPGVLSVRYLPLER